MATRPKLLDLFCGAGGCSVGYHRAGFDVVGVDIRDQPNYPFAFHRADAMEFLRDRGHEFDAIHASPPCQAYIAGLGALNRKGDNPHPKLIEPTRRLLDEIRLPWVIENVVGSPLQSPLLLCGSMFGLGVRRHRLFESNLMLLNSARCRHKKQGRPVGVYGQMGSMPLGAHPKGGFFIRAKSLSEGRAAMGIDWMTWKELTQAIPPAFTEFVGRQLLAVVTAP